MSDILVLAIKVINKAEPGADHEVIIGDLYFQLKYMPEIPAPIDIAQIHDDIISAEIFPTDPT